jgi:hypothetical protein
MYAKFAHVLTSARNIQILTDAVTNLSKAKHIECTPNEVAVAIESTLKTSIEDNVMGSRYLFSSESLLSANHYLVDVAIKTLQDKQSLERGQVEASKTAQSKRSEVSVSDRSLEIEDIPEIQTKKRMTPRELSRL